MRRTGSLSTVTVPYFTVKPYDSLHAASELTVPVATQLRAQGVCTVLT